MKERPILFTPENAQKVHQESKTQTRRVMPPLKHPTWTGYILSYDKTHAIECGPDYPDDESDNVSNRYGVPGDRLWVREAWTEYAGPKKALYKGDFLGQDVDWKWKNAMFMPRWACRTILEITDVRVERVQDISEEDAIAEGITEAMLQDAAIHLQLTHKWNAARPWASAYRRLWDDIQPNKKPENFWFNDPYVWAITFKKV